MIFGCNYMRQTDIIYWEPPLFFREGEDAELIVKKHIALLHLYNEAKDATQVRVVTTISRND